MVYTMDIWIYYIYIYYMYNGYVMVYTLRLIEIYNGLYHSH